MGPLGLLTVIALFVGLGPLSGKTPGENVSGATVAAFYNTHVARSWASIYVVGLGLALFVLFVSQLRKVLRDASGGAELSPNVVFAVGIILVAGMVAAGTFQVVLILAAHNHQLGIVKTVNFRAAPTTSSAFSSAWCSSPWPPGASILLNRSIRPAHPRRWVGGRFSSEWSAASDRWRSSPCLFGLPIWLIATGFVISTKARRAVEGQRPAHAAASGNGGGPDHLSGTRSWESASN